VKFWPKIKRTEDVSDAAWQQFLAAGFDRAAALEVVVGVAAYTPPRLPTV